MKHIKDGALVAGLQPLMLDTSLRLAVLFHELGFDFVLTEGTGGAHRADSLHYRGYAIDVRSRDIPEAERVHVRDAARRLLGPDYDVILESDHFHIEYDPRHDGGKALT